MITADKLTELITFTTTDLTKRLSAEGFRNLGFKSCKFLGMTNGNQFCYGVTYDSEDGFGERKGKVFLTYDPTMNRVTANFG